MKAERQQKEATSRTIQPVKGNGRLSFVDNRLETIAQKKLLSDVDQKRNTPIGYVSQLNKGYGQNYLKSDRAGFMKIRVFGFDQKENPFINIIKNGSGYIDDKYYELASNNTHFIEMYEAQCAPYPTAVKCIKGRGIETKIYVGLLVDLEFVSNTNVYTDIWNIKESEKVSESKQQEGVFAGEAFNSSNSGFMEIWKAKDDKHQMSKNAFLDSIKTDTFEGSYVAHQLDTYLVSTDEAQEKVIENSGYEIKREISGTKSNDKFEIRLITTKTPMAVTVGSYQAQAGPSETQSATVDYEYPTE